MADEHHGPPGKREASGASSETNSTDGDDLAALLDFCTRALAIAELRGQKLLSYLLAMAAEETRTAIQRSEELLRQGD